jgi:hypothetical protein
MGFHIWKFSCHLYTMGAWIRWQDKRMAFNWGRQYFSERNGYRVPAVKIGNFRIFVEKGI